MGPQLQNAIRAALRASTDLQTLIGSPVPVYDRVGTNTVPPYITIGDEQINDDGNSCEDAFEVFADIHVWARDVDGHTVRGKAFAKEIGKPVIDSLASELAIDDYTITVGLLDTARYFTEPDGVTAHGVLTFRYLIEPE